MFSVGFVPQIRQEKLLQIQWRSPWQTRCMIMS